MISLFESLDPLTRDIYYSLEKTARKYPTVVLAYDGFLPREFHSPYRFFMGDEDFERERPRYFNELVVPKFWEIKGDHQAAQIYDYDELRADVVYTSRPTPKRWVKVVNWRDRAGRITFCDHYDNQGRRYAETIYADDGGALSTTYFDKKNREVLVVNQVTGDFLLTYKKKTLLFHSLEDFIVYYLEEAGLDTTQITYDSLALPLMISDRLESAQDNTLIWKEPIEDEIPWNMQLILAGESKTKHILVTSRRVYERLKALAGEEAAKKLGFFGYHYPVHKVKKRKQEALILTNTDQLEGIAALAEGLSDYRIHIGALTEMSPTLLALERYPNVRLYPRINDETIGKLRRECLLYLDVNYDTEILSALREAFLSGMLIFAFEETAHAKCYTSELALFAKTEVQQMITRIQRLKDEKVVQAFLLAQYEQADMAAEQITNLLYLY